MHYTLCWYLLQHWIRAVSLLASCLSVKESSLIRCWCNLASQFFVAAFADVNPWCSRIRILLWLCKRQFYFFCYWSRYASYIFRQDDFSMQIINVRCGCTTSLPSQVPTSSSYMNPWVTSRYNGIGPRAMDRIAAIKFRFKCILGMIYYQLVLAVYTLSSYTASYHVRNDDTRHISGMKRTLRSMIH